MKLGRWRNYHEGRAIRHYSNTSLNSVLNVKALVGAFNQEKALVGAFFVIVKTGCGTDEALHSTNLDPGGVSAVRPAVVMIIIVIFT